MLFLLGHSSRNKKTHLIPIKPMTLLCFICKTSFFCSFILSYIYLSCALISHPALSSTRFLSHFELLSLSSCHRGKQNTVAMETAHREERGEAAYETSRAETEAYIWPVPVCGLGGSSTFYEHCVSVSCVKNYETDGLTDRVRRRRQRETKEDVWSLGHIDLCIWQELSCYC